MPQVELNKKPRPLVYQSAAVAPEVIYAGCSTTDLFWNPMPLPIAKEIAVGWNYLDGLAAFIATYELLHEDTYHAGRNKVKATLNILSGTSLFLLSDNFGLFHFGPAALASATIIASPAFAFGMLCDAINSSIDFFYARKEATFKGWLEERLLEFEYLKENEEKNNEAIKHLEKLIAARCRAAANPKIIRKIREYKSYLFDKSFFENLNLNDLKNMPSREDSDIDKQIQDECNKKFYETRNNFAAKWLSFVGMTCLAIASFVACPPLVIIGTVCVTLVSMYYMEKNSEKLATKLSTFGVFHRPPPAPDFSSPVASTLGAGC